MTLASAKSAVIAPGTCIVHNRPSAREPDRPVNVPASVFIARAISSRPERLPHLRQRQRRVAMRRSTSWHLCEPNSRNHEKVLDRLPEIATIKPNLNNQIKRGQCSPG